MQIDAAAAGSFAAASEENVICNSGILSGKWLASFWAMMLQGEALLRDLLAIHVVAHLNEALCQNYRKMCNASAELSQQCGQVMLPSSTRLSMSAP